MSVGCDTLSLLLALLPPLQDARPPTMRALVTSERTTLEIDWEGRVEQCMAAPGSARHGDRAAFVPAPQEHYPATLHTGPMLPLVEFSGREF